MINPATVLKICICFKGYSTIEICSLQIFKILNDFMEQWPSG